jgi:hypothetical protein
LKAAVAFALACAASGAQALEGVRSSFEANRALVQATGLSASDVVGPGRSGAAAVAKGAVNVTGPGGRVAAAQLEVLLSKKASMSLAARALPYVGVGLLIWDVYDGLRVRPKAGSGPDGVAFDPGQSQGSVQQWVYFAGVYTGAETASPETHMSASIQDGSGGGFTYVYNRPAQCTYQPIVSGSPPPCGGSSCPTRGVSCVLTGTQTYVQSGAQSAIQVDRGYLGVQTIAPQCPAYTDFQLGAMPAGEATGPDGKCRTGSYTQPMTADEAATYALGHENALTLDYEALVRAAIHGDVPPQVKVLPIAQSQDHKQEIVGTVPNLVGPTTTTQDANGTKTEAIGWNFARREDDLRRNEGRWIQKTAYSELDNQGQPTGTPSETTTDPGEEAGDSTETPDFCVSHPDRLGCIKAGDVADEPLQTQDRNVSLTPMAGWGGEGACPAAPALTLGFGTFTLDNTLLCNFLGAIKFVLLAVAGIVAVRIFIGGTKD